MQRPKKIVVIGLDGVPLSLIQRWAEADYLPNLQRLMARGAVGPLRSTVPPTSGPSWSSFVTGMNPGKTGIYDFLYRREGTYHFPPVNASLRGGKTVWRYLDEAGYRVGVLNLPMSYPVEKINGFIVSGWMTPYAADDFTHPPELAAELEREIGNYRIYPTETFAENRRESFLQASYDLLEMRTRTALYLARTREWDVLATVFFDTDRILHQLWHYLTPDHPWRTDREDKEPVVRDYFVKVDDSIGRLLELADDETLVLVLSDHGMGQANNFIVLNNWLLESGLLSLKGDLRTRLKAFMFRRGFTLRNIHQVADRLGLARQAEYVAGYFVDHLLKIAFLSFLDVDWSRSRAYSFGRHLGSIYVNVRGREPEGIVEPGAEYEAVRDEIEQLAYEFRDPLTGRPLIGEVLRREEIYSGPYFERAPDLILRPREPSDIFFGLADFGHRKTVARVYRYSGMHRDHGMLIMHGPGVRPGEVPPDAAIQDMAPTILHAMGLPVPAGMDGHVLEGAFQPQYMSAFPVQIQAGHEPAAEDDTPPGDESAAVAYTAEGEKEIIDRLEGLGYLG
ncbi:MAG: alkaline phosphatase family protein [Anaerolineae bacterium]|jgi:predicted AlkP superfamily phosphohydrolase/phosphomutase